MERQAQRMPEIVKIEPKYSNMRLPPHPPSLNCGEPKLKKKSSTDLVKNMAKINGSTQARKPPRALNPLKPSKEYSNYTNIEKKELLSNLEIDKSIHGGRSRQSTK